MGRSTHIVTAARHAMCLFRLIVLSVAVSALFSAIDTAPANAQSGFGPEVRFRGLNFRPQTFSGFQFPTQTYRDPTDQPLQFAPISFRGFGGPLRRNTGPNRFATDEPNVRQGDRRTIGNVRDARNVGALGRESTRPIGNGLRREPTRRLAATVDGSQRPKLAYTRPLFNPGERRFDGNVRPKAPATVFWPAARHDRRDDQRRADAERPGRPAWRPYWR